MAVGSNRACAVAAAGSIKCWGQRTGGALGDGISDTSRTATPVEVLGISNATRISSGSHNSCAVLNTGSIKCWGSSVNFQLGIRPFSLDDPVSSPVVIPGISGAIEVVGSYSVGCAIHSSRSMKCWGATSNGQIGAGPKNGTSWLPATQVLGIDNAVEVAVSGASVCARLTNG